MEYQKPKFNISRALRLYIGLAFAMLFLAGTVTGLAVPSSQIVSGLVGPGGIVLDEANNHLYFVEFTPGNLKRVDLSDPTYPVTTIASGLPQPVGLALDVPRDLAYVTTDNVSGHPVGTGGLWKVELSTGAATLITFNLGRPQQLVLNAAGTEVYTVGYNDGRLRRIDLASGVKVAVSTGLHQPMGLAITKNEQYAFVSQQGPPPNRAIVKIDLTSGSLVDTVTTSFSSPPAFLSWTDANQNALYVAERGTPTERNISRVDVVSYVKNTAIPGSDLPGQPSAMAARGLGTQVYVSMYQQIRVYDLLDLSGPVFQAVGHVPSSAITAEGYADTKNLMPGYFYQVEHCPFGGTVNMFGNFTNFLASAPTAVYYAVIKTKGASTTPLSHTWTVSRWDTLEKKYKPFSMTPALDGYKYTIPVESDGTYHADLWWYPFWIMRWPTGENGQYDFTIKLYDSTGTEITTLPAAFTSNNALTLYVDNTAPDVKIDEIWQKMASGDVEIQPCQIVKDPNNQFYFKITAFDTNQHLLNYRLTALWGDNESKLMTSDDYSAHVAGPPDYAWAGPYKEFVLNTSPWWSASCNCAHTFHLGVWKRTINGYNYIIYRRYHKSITIDNTGITCY